MGSFDHLRRCGDLSTADLTVACQESDTFGELLTRLEQVSAPNTGAASILIVLAALASNACDWVDGDLAVELIEVGDATEVGIMIELGAGMRERLFPPIRLRAPLAEVAGALEVKPDLVGALTIRGRTAKRVTLAASQPQRLSSLPPRISDDSMFVVRAPPPPAKPATHATSLDAFWDELDDPGKS